ncbi:polysaccharide deacetylase family protein [Goodfellowiella coeruleoviolacea]|uniref:Polysaccharide deacetylase n=1 Tax=Goodfellowiella coeruleoviolacea TaxID=334858 RepID=A0AAE3GH37_9PSEU|nr:polysaccharide deacetylase family protein [Goodfellowiella coeruleoviolacea]MCP2167235.1 Polysaccharide deacetylase [Goodfellowiella coeruleoviolacea]
MIKRLWSAPKPALLLSRISAFVVAALAMTVNAVPSHAVTPTAGPAPAACTGYVGLTYDDGPNPSSTRQLLAALQAAGAKATFFMMGSHEQQYPDLVRAVQAAGMPIGNHTWSHPHLTQLPQSTVYQEISQTQQVTQQLTGSRPTLFRPPYGETNATVASTASGLGLAQVLWSVDSQDWNGASTAQIVQAASRLQAGGIILMHDGGYQSTVNAVPQIVSALASRGLCPGRIVSSNGQPVVVAP